MTRPAILAVLILSALTAPAVAQMRTNNPGAPGVLRQWPVSGVWGTLLVRLTTTHKLGCVMLTGHRDLGTDEAYFWGIRRDAQDTVLEIIDSNPGAVSGTSISVTIDRTPVGAFPITKRIVNGSQVAVAAHLSEPQAARLINLMRVGGTVSYTTQTSTYTASLAGAGTELVHLAACSSEVAELERTGATGN